MESLVKRGKAYSGRREQWKAEPEHELAEREKRTIRTFLKKGLESRLQSIKKPRLIDIGGGTGKISYELASLFSEIVVVEQDTNRVEKLRETAKHVPQLKVWEGDFLKYVPDKKYDVALLCYMLFLMPRDERDRLLHKAISTVSNGWLAIVSNSITPKPGNQVHFRDYMQTRTNIIRGTEYTIEKRLKSWGYPPKIDEVDIIYKKKSMEEMADLISLVLRPEDRHRRQRILAYTRRYLQKPCGYDFCISHEILWARIK